MTKTAESSVLHFLYGGDLNADLQGLHCPSAKVVATARLPDHRMSFFGRSERWDGGEESVVPRPGDSVYGVVMRLSRSDSDRLDLWRGVKLDGTGRYFHSPADVIGEDGTVYPVLLYVKAERGPFRPPSTEYLEQIVAGAERRRLPAAYVAALRRTESVPATYRVPRPDGTGTLVVLGGGCAC